MGLRLTLPIGPAPHRHLVQGSRRFRPSGPIGRDPADGRSLHAWLHSLELPIGLAQPFGDDVVLNLSTPGRPRVVRRCRGNPGKTDLQSASPPLRGRLARTEVCGPRRFLVQHKRIGLDIGAIRYSNNLPVTTWNHVRLIGARQTGHRSFIERTSHQVHVGDLWSLRQGPDGGFKPFPCALVQLSLLRGDVREVVGIRPIGCAGEAGKRSLVTMVNLQRRVGPRVVFAFERLATLELRVMECPPRSAPPESIQSDPRLWRRNLGQTSNGYCPKMSANLPWRHDRKLPTREPSA